jgi:hypothetical protein
MPSPIIKPNPLPTPVNPLKPMPVPDFDEADMETLQAFKVDLTVQIAKFTKRSAARDQRAKRFQGMADEVNNVLAAKIDLMAQTDEAIATKSDPITVEG